MDDKVMEEASGLAYSKRQDGILWTHNDHGDDARVIAMSDEGQRIIFSNSEQKCLAKLVYESEQ